MRANKTQNMTKLEEVLRGKGEITFLRHSIGGIKGDKSDVKQGPGETTALWKQLQSYFQKNMDG